MSHRTTSGSNPARPASTPPGSDQARPASRPPGSDQALPSGAQPGRSWSGTVDYGPGPLHAPTTVEALQALVARSRRIRALGTRHSFSTIAASDAELVTLEHLPATIDFDITARTAAGPRRPRRGPPRGPGPRGPRHSFSTIAASDAELVTLEHLPATIDFDITARTVRVSAGVRYGELALAAAEAGLALSNM